MTAQNVLTKVWRKPRWVMQNISTESMPLSLMLLLIFFTGVSTGLSQGSVRQLGGSFELSEKVINAFLFGGLGMLLLAPLYFVLLHFVCKRFFGGAGAFEHTRYAAVLAMVPSFFTVILGVLAILLFGDEAFTAETPVINDNFLLLAISALIGLLQMILSIWSIFIFLTTLSEAHQFSRWKSFFSLITTAFIIAVPVIIVSVILRMI